MECRVEFDYEANEEDELTIKKGEIIRNVVPKMDGWYEGNLNGKVGVFPDNFVKIMEKSTPEPPKAKPSEVVMRNNPNSLRRVKVLFSYAPEQEDELALDIGDVLEFLEEVEEGWWRGRLNGKEGIFPSNFVKEIDEPKTNGNHGDSKPEVKSKDVSRSSQGKGIPDVVPASTPRIDIDDEPAPELPPKPVRELARCFYPYKAQNEDELTLVEGDIITIISRSCEDEGWWRGEIRGKSGLFPDNFVKIITPGESQSSFDVNTSQTKMVAQERGEPQGAAESGVGKHKKDIIPSSINTSVVDGGGFSKSSDKNKFDKSKVIKTNSKEVPPKGSHAATSPISPGIQAFHNNLFSNQKPADPFRREPPAAAKDDKLSDESEEFNSVERTETLNHLTANRAKAPKRRPPSAVLTRENDSPMVNGSSHSYEGSTNESPPLRHSTPINHSVTSNGTPSGSFDAGSLNHSGSYLSQSRDKEGSPTPSANSSGVSASKPKQPKQALPWMAELKKTQDLKKSGNTPGTSAPSVTSPVTTSPAQINQQTAPTPPSGKEAVAKAPPLPAKPSSLSSSGSQDKMTNNLNHSALNNSTYGVANKNFTKKSPSPALPNSTSISSDNIQRGDGDSNSNKGYVTYEEYAALKTRVTSLENELETLKRQFKMFMDRELRSHIV